jgi:hypothetical protein
MVIICFTLTYQLAKTRRRPLLRRSSSLWPHFYLSTKLFRASLRIHSTTAMQPQKIPRIIPASSSFALYDIEPLRNALVQASCGAFSMHGEFRLRRSPFRLVNAYCSSSCEKDSRSVGMTERLALPDISELVRCQLGRLQKMKGEGQSLRTQSKETPNQNPTNRFRSKFLIGSFVTQAPGAPPPPNVPAPSGLVPRPRARCPAPQAGEW